MAIERTIAAQARPMNQRARQNSTPIPSSQGAKNCEVLRSTEERQLARLAKRRRSQLRHIVWARIGKHPTTLVNEEAC